MTSPSLMSTSSENQKKRKNFHFYWNLRLHKDHLMDIIHQRKSRKSVHIRSRKTLESLLCFSQPDQVPITCSIPEKVGLNCCQRMGLASEALLSMTEKIWQTLSTSQEWPTSTKSWILRIRLRSCSNLTNKMIQIHARQNFCPSTLLALGSP